ncbi:MAG: PilZ domain-containing protein [Gammaproteobacteria bacterium]|nr:PilZ domain-containing protein [Gammaproteobacteria bacterium]MDE0368277.1 PilZ domain-containing protein [Gammaproteobacteria bacterium]
MQTLNLAIKDRMSLYECYMPFVRNGGLFIPTNASLTLGEAVAISLEFMQEPEPLRLSGTVVWITPQGAQGDRTAGVGIGFDAGGESMRRKIENCLAGAVASERHTHTL